MRNPIEKYTALVIQPHVKVAEDRSDISENLDRLIRMIDFGVGYFWEVPVRLVVLPEYGLQGVTTPGTDQRSKLWQVRQKSTDFICVLAESLSNCRNFPIAGLTRF